jgi:chemotaxis signal transduction protein
MIPTSSLAPGSQSYCVFQRGGLDFALPVRVAARAVPIRPLTPVPFAPPELCGVFLDRRRLVPVVRPDRWLGLPDGAGAEQGAWLLIDDGSVALAAVVDRLLGAADFSDRDLNRALAHPMALGMVAHASRTVVLLDAARLIPTITGSLLAAMPRRGKAG